MLQTPHDGLFKAVFCQPEHARGVLRAVVPLMLAEALDWQTLALRPGSFVDEEFTHQHTDLLYKVTWREGGEALVYLLFEHQSTPPTEGLMALRLLSYQDRIWERWRSDHPKARTLPMILPIVMYHGVTRGLNPAPSTPCSTCRPASGPPSSPTWCGSPTFSTTSRRSPTTSCARGR